MDTNELLNLYADFLICNTKQASATNLSQMVNGKVSHDAVTRLLSTNDFSSVDLWYKTKDTIRSVCPSFDDYKNLPASEQPIVSIDDSIIEKRYSSENELNCWHFDHCSGRSLQGINLVTALWVFKDWSLPVAYEAVIKDIITIIDDKPKRISKKTKIEIMLDFLRILHKNNLPVTYVVFDSWFSCQEVFEFIRNKMGKHFVCPIKNNRLLALSEANKLNGNWIHLDQVDFSGNQAIKIWLKGVNFPVLLYQQVFINKDKSTGILYLITDNLELTALEIIAIYEKRWKVEEYHKSIKSNIGIGKSPTHTIKTQLNHIFASLYAFVKLEKIGHKLKKNHFAVQKLLYIPALQVAYKILMQIC